MFPYPSTEEFESSLLEAPKQPIKQGPVKSSKKNKKRLLNIKLKMMMSGLS